MADSRERIQRPARPAGAILSAMVGALALVVASAGAVAWAEPPAAPTGSPGPAPTAPPQPAPPQLIENLAPASVPQSPAPQRFHFQIDPKTPLKDLLPTPPKVLKAYSPLLSEDLANVPEVQFQAQKERLPGPTGSAPDSILVDIVTEVFGLPRTVSAREAAHQIAKANHLNARQADGFVAALRSERPDLAGLPFAMGDACRSKGERTRQFTRAVGTVRRALQQQQQGRSVLLNAVPGAPLPAGPVQTVAMQASVIPPQVAPERPRPETFWDLYQSACAEEDRALPKADKALCEHVTLARIAALTQILGPETPEMRLGLVKYLSGIAHAESTRALARLAIFSVESEVRAAALEVLKVRRERDYTDVLLEGLRHPWPAAPRYAADAMAKLERADLVPQLVATLDAPDPRAPEAREVGGKKVLLARELVRVNHHQSCLLCHPPGNTDTVSAEALTAQVPLPGEPLPSLPEGYNNSTSPDLVVRVDVTYLRQDFSAMLPVADAAPWPDMQRFDFVVRERALTEEEAAVCREKLTPREPGRLPPHHRAALAALRELTGKDTAPTAEAWRQLLGISAPRR